MKKTLGLLLILSALTTQATNLTVDGSIRQTGCFYTGTYSTALGDTTVSSGAYAVATGRHTLAQGEASFAMGSYTQALNIRSFAGGLYARANNNNAFIFAVGESGSVKETVYNGAAHFDRVILFEDGANLTDARDVLPRAEIEEEIDDKIETAQNHVAPKGDISMGAFTNE